MVIPHLNNNNKISENICQVPFTDSQILHKKIDLLHLNNNNRIGEKLCQVVLKNLHKTSIEKCTSLSLYHKISLCVKSFIKSS